MFVYCVFLGDNGNTLTSMGFLIPKEIESSRWSTQYTQIEYYPLLLVRLAVYPCHYAYPVHALLINSWYSNIVVCRL